MAELRRLYKINIMQLDSLLSIHHCSSCSICPLFYKQRTEWYNVSEWDNSQPLHDATDDVGVLKTG